MPPIWPMTVGMAVETTEASRETRNVATNSATVTIRRSDIRLLHLLQGTRLRFIRIYWIGPSRRSGTIQPLHPALSKPGMLLSRYAVGGAAPTAPPLAYSAAANLAAAKDTIFLRETGLSS